MPETNNYAAAFSGLSDASVEDRLPNFTDRDGFYRVRLDEHRLIQGEQGMTFLSFVTVLAAQGGPNVASIDMALAIIIGGLSAPESWKQAKAKGRIRGQLAALLSVPPDSEQRWEAIAGFSCQHQILSGSCMILSVVTEVSKPNARTGNAGGKKFANINYAIDPNNPRPLAAVMEAAQAKLSGTAA
jgi:hypothetical protein